MKKIIFMLSLMMTSTFATEGEKKVLLDDKKEGVPSQKIVVEDSRTQEKSDESSKKVVVDDLKQKAPFDSSILQKYSFVSDEVLGTWVAERHLKKKETLLKLKQNLGEGLLSFGGASNPEVFGVIINNEGDKRRFGKTYITLETQALEYYQWINVVSKTKPPVVVSLATGNGRLPLSALYACETVGMFYLNDLSKPMLIKSQGLMRHFKLSEEFKGEHALKKIIHLYPGNVLTFLEDHKELIGKVDALDAQQLLHFLNPLEAQKVFGIINALLAPGGKAFISADTLQDAVGESETLKYYSNREKAFSMTKKKEDMYPGYMTLITEYDQKSSIPAPIEGTMKFSNIIQPKIDTPCGSEVLEKTDLMYMFSPEGISRIFHVKERTTTNRITMKSLENAVSEFPELEILKMAYLNMSMQETDKLEKGSLLIRAVLSKKK